MTPYFVLNLFLVIGIVLMLLLIATVGKEWLGK